MNESIKIGFTHHTKLSLCIPMAGYWNIANLQSLFVNQKFYESNDGMRHLFGVFCGDGCIIETIRPSFTSQCAPINRAHITLTILNPIACRIVHPSFWKRCHSLNHVGRLKWEQKLIAWNRSSHSFQIQLKLYQFRDGWSKKMDWLVSGQISDKMITFEFVELDWNYPQIWEFLEWKRSNRFALKLKKRVIDDE